MSVVRSTKKRVRKPTTNRQAVEILRQGGVILFPTETAYGFGADARREQAVEKIFALKGREAGKTPPLIVASAAMAAEYMELTPVLAKLAKKYWPGPLTIVGRVRKGLASNVVRSDGTVAMRVSSLPSARALSRGLGAPIVATSANRAGEPTCYCVEACMQQMKDAEVELAPDAILDVGHLAQTPPSTIVTEKKGKVVVLRQGTITI
jgi:L-threonylcarbamoyladenylate synthase